MNGCESVVRSGSSTSSMTRSSTLDCPTARFVRSRKSPVPKRRANLCALAERVPAGRLGCALAAWQQRRETPQETEARQHAAESLHWHTDCDGMRVFSWRVAPMEGATLTAEIDTRVQRWRPHASTDSAGQRSVAVTRPAAGNSVQADAARGRRNGRSGAGAARRAATAALSTTAHRSPTASWNGSLPSRSCGRSSTTPKAARSTLRGAGGTRPSGSSASCASATVPASIAEALTCSNTTTSRLTKRRATPLSTSWTALRGVITGNIAMTGRLARLHDYGRSRSSISTLFITSPTLVASATSMPFDDLTEEVVALVQLVASRRLQMKNCEPFVFGPEFAIATAPGSYSPCTGSSSNLYPGPPRPVPSGQPPWITKSSTTRWNVSPS